MDLWDETVSNDHIMNLLETMGLILFFAKDGEIFGAPEESRVVFAKMKQPDDDLPEKWADEANFSAYDLVKLLKGQNSQRIFSKESLEDIEVLTQDEAVNKLKKEVENPENTPQINMMNIQSMLNTRSGDAEPPNFIFTKER